MEQPRGSEVSSALGKASFQPTAAGANGILGRIPGQYVAEATRLFPCRRGDR